MEGPQDCLPAEKGVDERNDKEVPVEDGTKADNDEGTLAKETFRPWWRGNINIYLIVLAILTILTFWVRGTYSYIDILDRFPHATIEISIHYVAGITYEVFIFYNVFHTPSHGPAYRRWHIIIGRIILVWQTALVATGAYLVMYSKKTDNEFVNLSLTMTGIFSMLTLVVGYIAIRRQNVLVHKVCMTMLLFYGTGSAIMARVPRVFQFNDYNSFLAKLFVRYLHVLPIIFGLVAIYAFHRNTWI